MSKYCGLQMIAYSFANKKSSYSLPTKEIDIQNQELDVAAQSAATSNFNKGFEFSFCRRQNETRNKLRVQQNF
ncbi:hypothetical protein Pse7429DRAFT_0736 [Pseudanabaena biceps PCC 7429]|uniref:Uncharacterized protein n=1 Tax=Pseudanabaena biceps PCC 7429 TaxID=927668 RepID=L8N681_9CYAN|nr:hypothetical protein Pse7429DRAFT_0736 [Pseudanabaena biceps PCC 7429]